MCPMCEKRAQLVFQQQAVVESTAASKAAGSSQAGGKSYLFRNPFKSCKNLTHQCCSPLCESQRTSIASMRRSSVRPTPTSDHSEELNSNLLDDIYLVLESPLSVESLHLKENQPPAQKVPQGLPEPAEEPAEPRRKRIGLLTRLRLLTYGTSQGEVEKGLQRESICRDSNLTTRGTNVIAVTDNLNHEDHHVRGSVVDTPSNATVLAAESSLDTVSEISLNVTETNVSETTMMSMMNMNGSFCSPFDVSYRGSTLKSSTYDDDASSFAIVPRTSMQSSFVQDWESDASGLSDRFGELDIGYLSLEESGEGPDIDDTVSISSSQCDDLELHMHPEDDTVSESDLDQDYSVSTDSQEWCTETDDTASVLDRLRGHHRTRSKNHHHLHLPVLQTTPPHNVTRPHHDLHLPELQATPPHDLTPPSLPHQQLSDANITDSPLSEDPPNQTPDVNEATLEEAQPPEKQVSPLETPKSVEFSCSRCGRKEKKPDPESYPQPTTKKLTRKDNVMSSYFHTFMDGSDQALMAGKVAVLLGKYGNRKGLRVAGLPPGTREFHNEVKLSADELQRLRSIICPNNDAVTSFQNEVARMMLEGVDVPNLNMDVEQFIAGYMKLNSPFYIDLIEDFFKSVCIDCFGHMEEVGRDKSGHQRPAYTVLKPKKGPKSAVKHTGKR
ncbi:uncharacterized protein [Physcomitrium patens]|uniref:OVATE domain-containing protein n=1 Tax=Physcomitrium patens TaxID=3218 RepID=A0A2K1KUJ3_PHYPA|nr:uncharacterized protein LOC112279480 [Physcomitrium patens]XP_024369725.1 uncharacterized protein LOC112279480 [Physcomitrium patens]XP_024369726.1 uncharacterized protein LOC112279480 [Physcomitrium patens]XP_024369727.1 uncharacterized protein LOC112279480 [Physcomitrium patens]PNR57453.1 hypothetical protein PHYPA_004447 [Physcomitrium patens]|eukprot:XP_024369724.1 uncharacterized protein LOC112279480 [Physcomitrella patens]